MEQNLHKRVYINPNFKRTNIDHHRQPKETIATTHFNRHYVMETSKGIPNTNNSPMPVHNRKIFVNPIFLKSSNVASIPSKPAARAEHIAATHNVNKVPSIPLHKSKYSLVNNSQQIVKEPTRNVTETNKSPELFENTKKQTQEVPLKRSRYCIVRKKKRLSVMLEYKKDNSLATDFNFTKQTLTGASFNQLTCASLNPVKNIEKVKLSCKTPEKITKIKMSRYKIMPVNYLKNNSIVKVSQNKFTASPLKPYFMSNPKLSSSVVTCSRSRFRFVKAITPMKYNTPVAANKTASRISLKVDKGVLASGIKSKLSRANFNLNNIPCRLFKKYGKCLRQDQGNCKYLHDKKHVSLCRRFLKGICHDKNCSLSHELSDKKMPTCYFYLKGMCTKESCPYLHIKLNEKTKICQEFAKGYCESGDKCPFRHVIIKDLKKTRKRSLNSPRSSQNKVTKTKKNIQEKELTESLVCVTNSEECTAKDTGDCRYYRELEYSEDSYEAIKPTRCKLGTLPSFIQL